jgi:hypothetical protein
MSGTDDMARFAPGGLNADGEHEFHWQLTSLNLRDPVILELPPGDVLPVIFVPGIMGSNLRNIAKQNPIWRLDNAPSYLNFSKLKDKPGGLISDMALKMPGERQRDLNPASVEVDPGGAVPKQTAGSVYDASRYSQRGWGEVGEGSYHGFLLWLEQVLNGQGYDPAKWSQFSYVAVSATPRPGETRRPVPPLTPGIHMQMPGLPKSSERGAAELLSDDLIARARFRMPVYACGYNWLDSNTVAAQRLRQRILDVVKENSHAHSTCSQVVLVTHSMGGLVARACQQLDGMQDVIAGVVHGVMPAVGAAIAYRRCKIGMTDEGGIEAWVGAMVVGRTGQEVTAVFAQAPGALQLLPTAQYRTGWLTVDGPSGKSIAVEPNTGDPYRDIYLRRDRWWGLVREEWLSPSGGTGLKWVGYAKNLSKASQFHDTIKNSYHPNTHVFYGKDRNVASFEGVHWKVRPGAIQPDDGPRPSLQQVRDMGFDAVRDDGSNPLRVGGEEKIVTDPSGFAGLSPGIEIQNTSYWDLVCAMQDGGGDGTVPASSGAFPLQSGGPAIQQQFGLEGIGHEPAYHDHGARLVTLYSLQKIAAKAKVNA